MNVMTASVNPEVPEADEAEKAEGDAEGDDKGARPKLFLDDLHACVTSVLSHVPDAKWQHSTIEWAYATGCEFALAKKVLDPTAEGLVIWSTVREAIKDKIALDHRAFLPAGVVARPASCVPAKIVCAVKKAQDARKAHLETSLKDTSQIDRVKRWLTDNDLEFPHAMIPAFQTFQAALFQKCMAAKKGGGNKLNIADVVRSASEVWSSSMAQCNNDFEALAPAVCEVFAMHPDNHSIATHLFANPDAAQAWVGTRTAITMHAFKQILSAAVLMERTFVVELQHIDSRCGELATIDVNKKVGSPSDADSWTMMWFKCFEAVQASEAELQKLIESEHAAVRNRHEAEMKRLEENACKEAMTQASETSDAQRDVERSGIPSDPKFIEGRISVQASHSKLAALWESLIPLNDENDKAFDFKIEPQVRLTVFELAICEIKNIFARLSLDRSSGNCDTCLDDVFVDESAVRPGLFCKKGSNGMHLNLFGEVTTIPVVSAFKIGSIDGVNLYVRNKTPGIAKVSFFSCAWDARTVEYHPDTGEAVETPTCDVLFLEKKIELTWAAKFLGPQRKYLCTVKLPYLRLTDDFADHENFELTRPWHTAEVTSLDAPAKAYKSVLGDFTKAMKELSGGGAHRGAKQWQVVAKHLLS